MRLEPVGEARLTGGHEDPIKPQLGLGKGLAGQGYAPFEALDNLFESVGFSVQEPFWVESRPGW